MPCSASAPPPRYSSVSSPPTSPASRPRCATPSPPGSRTGTTPAPPRRAWRATPRRPRTSNARARRDAEIAAISGLRPTQAYIERTYGGEWEEARPDAAEPAAPSVRLALADLGDGDAIATAVDRLIEGEGWAPLMELLIQPVLEAARTSDDIEAFSA